MTSDTDRNPKGEAAKRLSAEHESRGRRHRPESVPQSIPEGLDERAMIVAWLRGQATFYGISNYLINGIERGEHRALSEPSPSREPVVCGEPETEVDVAELLASMERAIVSNEPLHPHNTRCDLRLACMVIRKLVSPPSREPTTGEGVQGSPPTADEVASVCSYLELLADNTAEECNAPLENTTAHRALVLIRRLWIAIQCSPAPIASPPIEASPIRGEDVVLSTDHLCRWCGNPAGPPWDEGCDWHVGKNDLPGCPLCGGEPQENNSFGSAQLYCLGSASSQHYVIVTAATQDAAKQAWAARAALTAMQGEGLQVEGLGGPDGQPATRKSSLAARLDPSDECQAQEEER